MSRKPATARHRTDTGSAELIDLLRAHGVEFANLGGAIDGIAWRNGRVVLVDFKSSSRAPMTANQLRLLGRDCPIAFVWDKASAMHVVNALKHGENGDGLR